MCDFKFFGENINNLFSEPNVTVMLRALSLEFLYYIFVKTNQLEEHSTN